MKFSNLNNLSLVKLFLKVLVFVAVIFNVNAAEIDLKKILPMDNKITYGKLENGVTYYVKNNQIPKNKAYVELVIKAGSLHENDDQQGLAHLLEHMAFNGTKSFPKNKIDSYLNSLGLSIGADFNASTGFTRTIYKLQVPTNTIEPLDTGVHILSEIASELTLEDEAFERERKIVEEEWRRDLGSVDRVLDQQKPYLFKNSKYLYRDPIGTMEVIRNFKYQTAKDFYNQWYRPELTGVFVIGDVDQKKAEEIIKKYFANIKAKLPPIDPPIASVPKYNETQFATITDSELGAVIFQILNRQQRLFLETGVNYRDYLTSEFMENIFQKRMNRILREQNTPLVSVNVGTYELSDNEEMYHVSAHLKDEDVTKGIKFLLTEIEKIKQNGFIEDELKLAKKDKLLDLEISLNQKNSRKSQAILAEYKSHFLEKEMVSGIDYEFELAKQVIKTIQIEDINKYFLKFYQPDDRLILVKGPEKYKNLITKEMFSNFESEIAKIKIPQSDFALASKSLINKELTGSKIIKEIKYSNLDITELHLANGVKVFLKPNKYKEKEFSFNARSPGGYSHIPLPKLYSAQNAQRIINDSGLGNFTRNEINDLYNPDFISIEASFSDEREGLYGRSITAYQKELFELIYLHFEEINYNPIAIEKLKVELKESLKFAAADPKRRFSIKFAETYYKNHPRIKNLTDKDIDQINIDDVKNFYKERFQDGSDFRFTFVGDFKIDEFKVLIQKYLGSLPNTGRKEKYVDDGVRAERGLVKYEVYENLENQSTHFKTYVNSFKNNVKNRFKVYVTQSLMKRMLHEEIREKQNLVYSISVRDYGITKIPEEQYTLMITFDCDPKNKDKIFTEVDKVIEKIKKGDFPQHYLDDAIKAQVTSYLVNRETNRWLVSAISGYYEDNEPLQMINSIDFIVKSINKNDIKRFANVTFKDKFIQASLMPKH